ncbi:MAG: sigma-70 family RNA polymerase sigma factor [Planctomycetaceae bacterium]|nr:sigma-70 family RNA polymerase sigma factor [Planctomycetaceae bacterium]
MTDTISSSLLERLQRHDAVAWQRMVQLFTPLVYQWARRSGLGEFDSADVVQDVFAGTLRGINRFTRVNPGDTFRGWLHQITRNKIVDFHRQRAGSPIAEGGSTANLRLHSVAQEAQFVSDDDAESTECLVRRGLELIRGEFEPRTWLAFEAVATGERPAAEVATELGMSVGAVYVAKSRVIKRLRAELEGLI